VHPDKNEEEAYVLLTELSLCSDVHVIKAELLTRKNKLISQQRACHVVDDHRTVSAMIDYTQIRT